MSLTLPLNSSVIKCLESRAVFIHFFFIARRVWAQTVLKDELQSKENSDLKET